MLILLLDLLILSKIIKSSNFYFAIQLDMALFKKKKGAAGGKGKKSKRMGP